jgi:DNA-binding transcriptional ArsR family regulator
MKDVVYLDRLEQAEALLKPRRIEILRRLAEPRTCTQIAAELGDSPQKVYYHVKRLQQAGLVELVDERRVRGINEGIYRAVAGSFWLSPRLVGTLGPRNVQDAMSLGFLLDLAEELQADLAQLAATRSEPRDDASQLPSLGIAGEVRLAPEHRAAFLDDLNSALQGVLTRYGGKEGEAFRIALACYPKGDPA